MKKYNTIAITLIVLSMLAHSCGPALAESSEPFSDEEWNRTYNVPAVDDTHWIERTSDGGYIYSAIVEGHPENATGHDKLLGVKFVKLDKDGNIEWQKRDEGYSIKPTSDGGYVTARGFQLVKFGESGMSHCSLEYYRKHQSQHKHKLSGQFQMKPRL